MGSGHDGLNREPTPFICMNRAGKHWSIKAEYLVHVVVAVLNLGEKKNKVPIARCCYVRRYNVYNFLKWLIKACVRAR